MSMNLYKNSPTAGGTDGVKVVAGNPIITPYLDLASSETCDIVLALRCDTGEQSTSSTVITPAAAATTLATAAAAGANSIIVASATALQVGNRIAIGAGDAQEIKRITAIADATLSLESALGSAHASGAVVECQSKFQIALAGADGVFGEYGAALTLSSVISDVNTLIRARVRAITADGVPCKDVSSWLAITYEVGVA